MTGNLLRTAHRSQTCYGRKDSAAEAKVKEVFGSKEVDIPGRFAKYEQESYEKITGLIAELDETTTGLKKSVFESFLNKVYKRSK